MCEMTALPRLMKCCEQLDMHFKFHYHLWSNRHVRFVICLFSTEVRLVLVNLLHLLELIIACVIRNDILLAEVVESK